MAQKSYYLVIMLDSRHHDLMLIKPYLDQSGRSFIRDVA